MPRDATGSHVSAASSSPVWQYGSETVGGKGDGMRKYLIINADDFGASVGINRGIVDSHTCGVVTSTSLMVTGRAVREAVVMTRDCPGLSLGLHWDISGEG